MRESIDRSQPGDEHYQGEDARHGTQRNPGSRRTGLSEDDRRKCPRAQRKRSDCRCRGDSGFAKLAESRVHVRGLPERIDDRGAHQCRDRQKGILEPQGSVMS